MVGGDIAKQKGRSCGSRTVAHFIVKYETLFGVFGTMEHDRIQIVRHLDGCRFVFTRELIRTKTAQFGGKLESEIGTVELFNILHTVGVDSPDFLEKVVILLNCLCDVVAMRHDFLWKWVFHWLATRSHAERIHHTPTI